jgi:branched-subunit amino acid transport protein
VSTQLVLLAVLMGLVTYPSRALPLLAPGIERLPRAAIEYLRLVGPAVLSALAAVSVMVVTTEGGSPTFHVGIEWLAVAVAGALTVWRRNLLLGLLGAVALVAVARALGIAELPLPSGG